MDVKDYMNTHRERMLEELLELLRIPSISADPAYAEHTLKCADVVADHLRKAGADNVEVVATKGYPVVYGEKLVDPTSRRCWCTDITTCSLPTPSTCGTARHSNL